VRLSAAQLSSMLCAKDEYLQGCAVGFRPCREPGDMSQAHLTIPVSRQGPAFDIGLRDECLLWFGWTGTISQELPG